MRRMCVANEMGENEKHLQGCLGGFSFGLKNCEGGDHVFSRISAANRSSRTTIILQDCTSRNNGGSGVFVGGNVKLISLNTELSGNSRHGLEAVGDADVTMIGGIISNNGFQRGE